MSIATAPRTAALVILLALASCAEPEPEPEPEARRTVDEYIERVEKDYARFREDADRTSGEPADPEGIEPPEVRPLELERELKRVAARIRHLEAMESDLDEEGAGVEGKMREYEERHKALMAEYETLVRDLMRMETEREARKK